MNKKLLHYIQQKCLCTTLESTEVQEMSKPPMFAWVRKRVARQCFAIVRMIVISLVLFVGAMYSNGKRPMRWLSHHKQ